MARVKLTPLDTYPFSVRLIVRSTDLNRADHLSAYALVGMLDAAYAQFIRELDLGQPGLGAPNLSSINADLQVNYLGEGKLHDELVVEMATLDLTEKSFRIHYRLTCDDRPIALAEIGVVCFDYGAKKPAPLPQVFVDAIARLAV
mgnify:CR=1 FL=1